MAEAYLEKTGGYERLTYPLDPGVIYHIGRASENEMVVEDSQASRRHALLECRAGRDWMITDLGSRNGTFLNGRRLISPTELHEGDRIRLGSVEFAFHGEEARTPSAQSRGDTLLAFDQRLITVLVADIRNYTGLAQSLGELMLSQCLSELFREAGMMLVEHGSWAQKYIGDAVMAIWIHESGVPQRNELVAVFASAQRLFEMVGCLHTRLGLPVRLRIGCGINTGMACVGNVGSPASADYTAISEAVNLAFRLESASKQIGADVVTGARTREVLEGFNCAELFSAHTVALKGYETPKAAYGLQAGSLPELIGDLRQLLTTCTQQLIP